MNRVEITGTPSRLPRVHEVDGVHVVRSSVEELPDGRYRVGGYATDAQIAQLEALDLEVRVIEAAEDRQARLQAIARDVREGAEGG